MLEQVSSTKKKTLSPGWPLLMAYIRLPLVLIGSGVVILAYEIAGKPVGVAAGLAWSTFTITIVNLISLGLLVWRTKVEHINWSEIVGFNRRRLLLDLGMGLMWSLLLGALLLAGMFGVLLALVGTTGLANFETIFFGDANLSFEIPVWMPFVSALLFPFINPVVEEMQYRGYAQPGLISAFGRVGPGILVTALGFGLQHVVFALTPVFAAAYTAGFFLWGIGAGILAYRQKRLVPLIIAHFISNLSFGVIPLFFVFQ